MGLIGGAIAFIQDNLVIFVLSILIGVAGGLKIKTMLASKNICDPNDTVCNKMTLENRQNRTPATSRDHKINRFFRPGTAPHD